VTHASTAYNPERNDLSPGLSQRHFRGTSTVMTAPPLTHHEILELVAPFARRGRHVDLGRSQRLERRLAFKPVEHGDAIAQVPGIVETLSLENPHDGSFRLTRVLALPCGLEARLRSDGPDPAELLARIEAVPPSAQIETTPEAVLVRSHRVVRTGATHPDGTPATRLILSGGVARVGGLTLTMNVLDVKGTPGEIELRATTGGRDLGHLPEDLLAVQGWSWSRLTRNEEGWKAGVRLARTEPERSDDATRKLDAVVQHLVRTLSEAPARFHQRHLGARWLVFLRRAFPLLASIGLIGGTLAIPRVDVEGESMIRMLMFHSPPLLLIAFFCMRELPRIEIPPLPRRLHAAAWMPADDNAAGSDDASALRPH
jgi:hypothetical protein